MSKRPNRRARPPRPWERTQPKESSDMSDETARGRYSVAELEAMPTLSQAQTDDLKVDTGTVRVWLSRMTVEDGMPYDNQVTVEKCDSGGGGWKTARTYRAPKA